jgi:hypothetical protein
MDKRPALQTYKAKLVRLHASRRNKPLLDIQEHDRLDGEEPSLFHVLKMHKRRVTREIRKITDTQGNTHTTYRNIAATFVDHLYNKYEPIEVDGQSMATIEIFLPSASPTRYAALLEQPITSEELLAALRTGARHKSPGIDGLPLELYKANWETIQQELLHNLNHMFLQKHLTPKQKQEIIMCPPKSINAHTPDDYRPISLLTT